ncbi:MAG TPA: hypothetical protein VGB47_08095 [Thermoanaerobaculia bacterium]
MYRSIAAASHAETCCSSQGASDQPIASNISIPTTVVKIVTGIPQRA